ncbi:MAG: DUF4147 domain-containing protein [Chloroflexi bacterium]|nr:MAG: DUF4147 domain-containing protein [Chloroflexota bacterium]MBL1196332.1 DUF4147 domain-containing protein [Chloroflexota bacterium]NOH13627.1 DUF4147 domain-containing protein [Chloroflexota bacterium]
MSRDFGSQTLKHAPWGPSVTRIMAAALAAVDPRTAMQATLKVKGNQIIVEDHKYNLDAYERIFIIGAGKAATPMTEAAVMLLEDRITDGLVITKDGHAGSSDHIGPVRIIEAAHPLPDQRGVDATHQMLGLLKNTTTKDLIICLISGGGSALLTAPVDGLTLDEYRDITDALLARGAPIQEVNTLRKHLDLVKGGGLAQAAAPAQIISFILSDVVGDPLDIIASGPTVTNPSTATDAIKVVKRYDLRDLIPADLFASWQTISPHQSQETKAHNLIIANNAMAIEAAVHQARDEGFQSERSTEPFEGEARELGLKFANHLHQLATQKRDEPLLLVAGGESTVTIQGTGIGGRNQELALATVEALAGMKDIALITLATDGGDGPTDAAGGVVTGRTLSRAHVLGIKTETFLNNNDSYTFFNALDDLIITGPTQTNVNDLVFLFVF